MTRIEQYLTHAIELDALSDAEKCAICAAMEGEWIRASERSIYRTDYFAFDKGNGLLGCDWRDIEYCELDPLHSRDHALRLVERFGLILQPDGCNGWCCYPCTSNPVNFASTPQAAIVACVCALALERWNA